MTSRERVRTALAHKEADRIPISDSPWGATINRWRLEGMPAEIPVDEYFGYEFAGFGADLSPRFPVKIVQKDETYIIETNSYGGMRKNFRDYSTTPEVIDWPVKSKEDWEKIKPRLEPHYTRVDWVSLRTGFQRAREDGKYINYCAAIGYDLYQSYLKSEDLLVAMVTDPEWVREMFMTNAEMVVAMAKMMMESGFDFDGAFLFNDMGYRNASLFSPQTYRKTTLEADTMMCSFFHDHGMPVMLHSCGCVKELIPHLIEAGFDCLQPLEVKAGMDLVELKQAYGDRLTFMGGIDVRAMADPDPSVIEKEISTKIPPAKKGGGYIYHSDHSVPKNVSFAQYKRVIELVHQYGKY